MHTCVPFKVFFENSTLLILDYTSVHAAPSALLSSFHLTELPQLGASCSSCHCRSFPPVLLEGTSSAPAALYSFAHVLATVLPSFLPLYSLVTLMGVTSSAPYASCSFSHGLLVPMAQKKKKKKKVHSLVPVSPRTLNQTTCAAPSQFRRLQRLDQEEFFDASCCSHRHPQSATQQSQHHLSMDQILFPRRLSHHPQ